MPRDALDLIVIAAACVAFLVLVEMLLRLLLWPTVSGRGWRISGGRWRAGTPVAGRGERLRLPAFALVMVGRGQLAVE